MKFETSCPMCKSKITMGTFLSASTPSRIICKSCKSRLRPDDDVKVPMYIIFVIAGAVGFLSGFSLATLYLNNAITMTGLLLTLAIIIIPLVIIAELLFIYLVCNKSRLVPASFH